MLRSNLGGHFSSVGIANAYDDFKIERSNRKRGGVKLPTDKFKETKEFDAYCSEQSGEVRTYRLETLKSA